MNENPKSIEQVRRMMQQRISLVGPIPRSVFKNSRNFERLWNDITSKTSMLFSELSQVSVGSIPSQAAYFSDPFFK